VESEKILRTQKVKLGESSRVCPLLHGVRMRGYLGKERGRNEATLKIREWVILKERIRIGRTVISTNTRRRRESLNRILIKQASCRMLKGNYLKSPLRGRKKVQPYEKTRRCDSDEE